MQEQAKANEFHDISKNIFYPIYPVIAEQILETRKGKKEGTCLDIGSGPGYVGLAIAKQTKMQVCLYDMSKEALEIAKENIKEALLEERVYVKLGNSEKITFPDKSFDLVSSRGSLFFWQDKVKAIHEILRVLKPGGTAYIGGGFGNRELKNMVDEKMLVIDDKWLTNAEKRRSSKEEYECLMKKTKINGFTIKDDDSGLWIIFQKNMIE
ncbi:class I SAM-dependent methyltransferase [Acetobacterium tundrae]|uniref:Methyltransferase domain-containing protein n=1 Tax=Acetobacterium tundrae TaxID=132932 RepID=A0ABR6WN27_9FIRM|nr:class I SAM-dependent methyltransferase [Acetobacterium tundrae]MBC3797889.1 methyltransferase domain-containing protein [Acetobacterium tundrae]